MVALDTGHGGDHQRGEELHVLGPQPRRNRPQVQRQLHPDRLAPHDKAQLEHRFHQ
jgi:hypothetical protein